LFSFKKDDVLEYLELAKVMKQARKENAVPRLLEGKTLGMLFELPSTRTRVSFSNAMTLLGGHALFLKPGEIHYGKKEKLKDTSRVLSSMCDGLVMRAWKHDTIEIMDKYSEVPVINGLTDYNHPSQALSDLFTIMETTDKLCNDIKIVYVGDKSNVFISLLHICLIMNISITQVAPKKYQIEKSYIDEMINKYPDYSSEFKVTDKFTALKNADYVYTDLWWWVHQEDEKASRLNAFYDKYTVTEEVLKKTKNPNVKFMHCLPANRELEVNDEVLEGDSSIVFHQSENRLYIEMAILAKALYIERDEIKVKDFETKILNQLK